MSTGAVQPAEEPKAMAIPMPTPPAKPVIETVYCLKASPSVLLLYVVEELTIEDDIVIERKLIKERDTLDMCLNEIEIRMRSRKGK